MKERVYIKELKKQSEINNIYSGYQPEIMWYKSDLFIKFYPRRIGPSFYID